MKYNIISINDVRADYKARIRDRVHLEEIHIPAVNGNDVNFFFEFESRELKHGSNVSDYQWHNATKGELGVWLSNYDCWSAAGKMDEPLIVFEDDAIPSLFFDQDLGNLMTDLPEDWDVFTLWVPDNQVIDYRYEVWYDEHGHPAITGTRPLEDEKDYYYYIGSDKVTKTYQGYGMVANMYSPQGGQKLVELAHRRGVDNPVDCWVFEEIHKGNLNGYAPHPRFVGVVSYDWAAETHIHKTERAL